MTATRLEVLPDIPTVGDFVPEYEASSWLGFGAPKNTAAAVVDRLNNEINLAISDSAIKARLVDLGGLVLPPSSPAEFAKFLASDTEKWARVRRNAPKMTPTETWMAQDCCSAYLPHCLPISPDILTCFDGVN
jgi:tripartite-type tricarboxylate transporter receptor subunit TctC